MKKLSSILVGLLLALPMCAFAAGAIAVDDEEGETEPGYGFVTGASSRDAAGKGALKQCKDSGNDNCKVVARFDTCGAYAASKKYYGAGWGASKQKAESMALDTCSGNCTIIVSACE